MLNEPHKKVSPATGYTYNLPPLKELILDKAYITLMNHSEKSNIDGLKSLDWSQYSLEFRLYALERAFSCGHIEVVSYLMTNPMAPVSNKILSDALNFAIHYKKPELVKYLLDHFPCRIYWWHFDKAMKDAQFEIVHHLFQLHLTPESRIFDTYDNACALTSDSRLKALFIYYSQHARPLGVLESYLVTITYEHIMAHPEIHLICDKFDFKDLCAAANIEMNSELALRVYAKIQVSRYMSKEEIEPHLVNAFTAVISAKEGEVAAALTKALKLVRPDYTRLYSIMSYTARAEYLPDSVVNHFKL